MSTIIDHEGAFVQTRTQGIFAIPVPFGSGGAAKVGVDITPLNITITPVKTGNVVELSFVVFGVGDFPALEAGFFLKRNGTNLLNTTDGSDNYYAINAITTDNGSTATTIPMVTRVVLFDNNSLDVSSTYTLAVRHTSSIQASTSNFYLNRPSTTPADGVESGVSTVTITEYDQ